MCLEGGRETWEQGHHTQDSLTDRQTLKPLGMAVTLMVKKTLAENVWERLLFSLFKPHPLEITLLSYLE